VGVCLLEATTSPHIHTHSYTLIIRTLTHSVSQVNCLSVCVCVCVWTYQKRSQANPWFCECINPCETKPNPSHLTPSLRSTAAPLLLLLSLLLPHTTLPAVSLLLHRFPVRLFPTTRTHRVLCSVGIVVHHHAVLFKPSLVLCLQAGRSWLSDFFSAASCSSAVSSSSLSSSCSCCSYPFSALSLSV
jgi:hypothetical protein